VTEAESLEIVTFLAGNYPDAKLTPMTAKAIRMMMPDVPFAVAFAALPGVMERHPTFCPPVPAIAKAIKDLMRPESDGWAAAWLNVQQQVKDVGWWGKPTFDDPLTWDVVRSLGGWVDGVCSADLGNAGHTRPQFRDIYNELAASDQRAEMREAIAGGMGERIAGLGSGLKRMSAPNGNVVPMVKVGTGR